MGIRPWNLKEVFGGIGSPGSLVAMPEQGVKKTVATEGTLKKDKEAGKAEETLKDATAKTGNRRSQGT